jgi:hypothetical protein
MAGRTKQRLPDLVHHTRLETEFRNGLFIHLHHVSDPSSRRRAEIQRVTYQEVKIVGQGGFGNVRLEKRIAGPAVGTHPELRAVKKIYTAEKKVSDRDYVRELEAIAKFSHARVSTGFSTEVTMRLTKETV